MLHQNYLHNQILYTIHDQIICSTYNQIIMLHPRYLRKMKEETQANITPNATYNMPALRDTMSINIKKFKSYSKNTLIMHSLAKKTKLLRPKSKQKTNGYSVRFPSPTRNKIYILNNVQARHRKLKQVELLPLSKLKHLDKLIWLVKLIPTAMLGYLIPAIDSDTLARTHVFKANNVHKTTNASIRTGPTATMLIAFVFSADLNIRKVSVMLKIIATKHSQSKISKWCRTALLVIRSP